MVDLRNYISVGDTINLIVTQSFLDKTNRVQKYLVTEVYPYICICAGKKGKKRVAGIGDLVMSHSLFLPENPLTLMNIEEEP